jgi:hypothetical protein
MKARPLLALALLLVSALAFVAPAYAQVSVTAKASYAGGWPPAGASVRCLVSGTPTSFGPMTPAGVTKSNCDPSTPLLPDAMGQGGTSSDQFSAVPLTYGLVGYWPFGEGSGSKAYDLSHNNNTLTIRSAPSKWLSSGCGAGLGACLNFTTKSTSPVASNNNTSLSPTSLTIISFNYFYNLPNPPPYNQYYLELLPSSGGGIFGYRDGTSTGLEMVFVPTVGGATYVAVNVPTKQWLMTTLTYSPSQECYRLNVAASTCHPISGTFPAVNKILLGNGMQQSEGWTQGPLIFYNRVLSFSELSELYASTIPNLEQSTGASGGTLTTTYYEQQTQTVDSGSNYVSLGQTLTAGTTGTYWVDSPTTVTQPIKLTSTQTGTFAISDSYAGAPCHESPTSIASDSTPHAISLYARCQVTITVPADGSGSRWRFTGGGATTATVTACASGTCSESDKTAAYEWKTTQSYSVSGGGSPTAPTLTGTQNGSAYAPTLTGTPTTYWLDDQTAWSVTNPLAGSGSTERWESGQAVSGTVSSAFTAAFVYHHQYEGNFSETFTGGTRTPTNGAPLSYTAFGVPATLVLTGSYQSVFVDASAAWSVPNPFYSNFVSYVPTPESGTMSAPLQQIVAFTAGTGPSATCSGPNPLVIIENNPSGCLVPGIVDVLDAPIGLQPWAGFVVLGVNVAIFNKSQATWMALLVLWVSGAAFGWLLPAYAAELGQIFLYLGAAGIVLKVIFRFW